MISPESLNITLDSLQPHREPPPEQKNRLCICISDVHFTDGTVGRQSAEGTVWKDFFAEVITTCKEYAIQELTLVLVGDVADMIRTAVWAQENVYPWQRDDPKFPIALRKIMAGIVDLHAKNPDAHGKKGSCGFFYHLRSLPQRLADVHIETLVLLGNHDKEICADPDTLKMFYEDCLGQKVANLSPEYRRWIGKMYGDETRFLDPQSVPWLPFYWGDAQLRLFLTHGQWRDSDNSRLIAADSNQPGWTVKDGWCADVWQQLNYRPFTDPCFGDTVAAGVLSTFIYRAKNALNEYKAEEAEHNRAIPDLHRIECILDELDLYRPSSTAVTRILQETQDKGTSAIVRDIVECELYRTLCDWLNWDFTLESSPPMRRLALKAARLWLILTGPLRRFRIQLTLVQGILWLMGLIEKLRPLSVYRTDGASYKDIQTFPTFQEPFWRAGFRIHGEGHTHVPLESDVDVSYQSSDIPKPSSNFTYINFGTWRDQVLAKENKSYRRRGVGRALFVLNLPREEDKAFQYYVEDALSWSDGMDRL